MGEEPRKRGKGRRSDIPWEAIREAYASGETDFSELGRRFGVSRNTVARRQKSENWATKEQVAAQSGAKIIDLATRKALERMGGEEHVIESVADELLATQTAAKLAGQFIVSVLTKAKDGEIRPAIVPGAQTEADVARAVMLAYRTFTETVRSNSGLRPGIPSVPKPEPPSLPGKRYITVVEPEPKTA